MKINYFDLGIYHGEEIEMFLNAVAPLNIEYYDNYMNLLREHNITILPFCKELHYNINLTEILKQL
jgi:hypothetical protein